MGFSERDPRAGSSSRDGAGTPEEGSGEVGSLHRCLFIRKLEVQWLFSSPGLDFSVSLIIFHSIPCATSWLRGHIAARRDAWYPFWGGLGGFALCQLSVLVHLTVTQLEMQTRVVASRC